ncbi:MAG: sodium:solute symporter family protein [Ignavibacteriae bacterium]|nr:sodium:solute symporter family protein [Ignavibacteriota bacterium]MCB9216382.1 sodium:solute symporter family protein [Ignavibacteria bacterium]
MYFLGLHLVDWLILAIYFVAIIWIALRARKRIQNTEDFYQGNRSFGKILTAFLNFGNMTDAGQVAFASREIYRQGISGIWISNVVLFHTPFQWFISAWQRRARYIGPGDMFLHRYESKFLAGLYALVLVIAASYGNTTGFLLTGKTLQAMMVKPEVEYSVEERASVEGFLRLKELRALDYGTLNQAQQEELEALTIQDQEGNLHAFISYLDLTTFYILYAILIAAYTILGGLFAIALVDVIQGILIIFLSLILIPLGLSAIGGLVGLQNRVPDAMTELFGSGAGSEYTWYFVAGLALLNLVVNAPKSFTLGGSPKDDRSARLGFVGGALSKRFMMLGWAFTGLIAVGLYAGSVSDPTNIWGVMTRDLLGVGAIGLMIAAIFSANMDGAATSSLDASAAFTKNIWEPVKPGTSERTQVGIGRLIIGLILLGSVLFSTVFDNVVDVFKYALSVGAIVGPAFWMAFFWRRVNTKAVAIQMLISLVMTVVAANLIPAISALNTSSALTQQTAERVVEFQAKASEKDVSEGLATTAGEMITKSERIPPQPIFFTSVSVDESGVVVGGGTFRTNVWLLDKLGFDFSSWNKAGIETAGFLFDAIFPFVLLILISIFTKPNSDRVLREFYARVNTPAVADPEEDARLVQEKIDNPELVEQNKMFPHTNIEFWKPTRFDILGFAACVAFVALIIGLYMILSSIARG